MNPASIAARRKFKLVALLRWQHSQRRLHRSDSTGHGLQRSDQRPTLSDAQAFPTRVPGRCINCLQGLFVRQSLEPSLAEATLERFLAHATAIGVPDSRVRRARKAVDEFETCALQVGGDRKTFLGMLASWNGFDVPSEMPSYCRLSLSGEQAHLGCVCKGQPYNSCSAPARITLLDISLRHLLIPFDKENSLGHSRSEIRGGRGRVTFLHSFLAEGETTGLIREFCRGPLPEFSSRLEGSRAQPGRRAASGPWKVVTAEFDATGEIDPHTLVFGQNVPQNFSNHAFRVSSATSYPTERMIIDVFSHHSLKASPRAPLAYSGRAFGSQMMPSMPITQNMQRSLAEIPSIKEFSSYSSLIHKCISESGHALSEFSFARVEVEFPPTGISVALEFDPWDFSPNSGAVRDPSDPFF